MMLERWRGFLMGVQSVVHRNEPPPAALLAWMALLAVLAGGCGGRSEDFGAARDAAAPDGATPDGSTSMADSAPSSDAGGCNAHTCPSGCCNSAGTCLAGTDITACGTLGQTCANCQAAGHNLCDSTLHACGDNVGPQCDPANCQGCCSGSQCLVGTNLNACGQGGAACTDCATSGQTCQASSGSGGSCQTAAT